MDLRHLEALRKAAPQLQIVTVHMDVSSTHLHSVSALSGIVLVTAPASEPWVISWRQWKARSCLLSNYLPAGLSHRPASCPARGLTDGDTFAEPLDQEYAEMVGNFDWESACSSIGNIPGAQHEPVHNSPARSRSPGPSMAERFR